MHVFEGGKQYEASAFLQLNIIQFPWIEFKYFVCYFLHARRSLQDILKLQNMHLACFLKKKQYL